MSGDAVIMIMQHTNTVSIMVARLPLHIIDKLSQKTDILRKKLHSELWLRARGESLYRLVHDMILSTQIFSSAMQENK